MVPEVGKILEHHRQFKLFAGDRARHCKGPETFTGLDSNLGDGLFHTKSREVENSAAVRIPKECEAAEILFREMHRRRLQIQRSANAKGGDKCQTPFESHLFWRKRPPGR